VLCGPTGIGKSEVAALLAERHGLDIISADSRQVYTWLDIGTAKPPRELRARLGIHMVDMVEPSRCYSAVDYARDALAVMRRLAAAGRGLLVVGGAGFYLRALFEPLFDAPRPDPELRRRLQAEPTGALYERLRRRDPVRAAQLHPNDRQRVARAIEVVEQTGRTMAELVRTGSARREYEPAWCVLDMPRAELYRRINERFDAMMAAGLLDEVRRLVDSGFGRDTYVANAYGYAELMAHLAGELSLADAVDRAKAKSRAYARRQLSWFRSLADARWVETTTPAETAERVEQTMRAELAPV
jgi:tRNA dimethylallyltransferase